MISVIIPSYNSASTIRRCLEAIERQSCDHPYEVIVVDSSIDDTAAIVRSLYPKTKLIHLDHKTDPGTARNIGVQKSKGEIIAFIDSDCVAAENWLERISEAHKKSYRVVGGSVNNGNDECSLIAWAGYLAEFREFLPTMPTREVMHIPTCNISYKRGIFSEFGFFQGQYYPQEDLVYNYGLWKNGEKILLDPSIQVHHLHRVKPREFFEHQNKIGAVTSRVLRVLPLEGSSLARHPFLATVLVPLLCGTKFLRTITVFLKYQPKIIVKRPAVLLVFLAGLAFWGRGFARGARNRV